VTAVDPVPAARELFIYWRTALDAAPAAQREAARWQDELCRRHPGLRAALYRRADESAAGTLPRTTTLMETYAGPVLNGAVEALIIQEGQARLAAWLEGPRKVEAFERCE